MSDKIISNLFKITGLLLLVNLTKSSTLNLIIGSILIPLMIFFISIKIFIIYILLVLLLGLLLVSCMIYEELREND